MPDSIFDRSRMSLISVSRSDARRVNRLRELDLLAGEVRVRIVGEQLGQDEQRVERRAQLVRHVRQELALVLRRERELARLVLELTLGVLDLAVLALDLFVLRLQQPRFLFQLFVGLLQLFLLRLEQLFRRLQRLRLLLEPLVRLGQLFLLRLQLLGERLRLRQQLFGPHVRLDRVEHDADRLGELIEQRQIGLGEAVERGQLHHRQHLALRRRSAARRCAAASLRRGRS